MIKIFGIETDDANRVQLADKFELVFEDSEDSFYQSIEVFRHAEDGLTFDYRYGIEVLNYDSATGEDTGNILVSLQLIPVFGSLCKKTADSVRDCVGVDDGECDCDDIMRCGAYVHLAETMVPSNGDGLEDTLDAIATVFETIDSLRGFYLDRAVNLIGTTGWDLLNDFINGRDFVRATLDRHDSE